MKQNEKPKANVVVPPKKTSGCCTACTQGISKLVFPGLLTLENESLSGIVTAIYGVIYFCMAIVGAFGRKANPLEPVCGDKSEIMFLAGICFTFFVFAIAMRFVFPKCNMFRLGSLFRKRKSKPEDKPRRSGLDVFCLHMFSCLLAFYMVSLMALASRHEYREILICDKNWTIGFFMVCAIHAFWTLSMLFFMLLTVFLHGFVYYWCCGVCSASKKGYRSVMILGQNKAGEEAETGNLVILMDPDSDDFSEEEQD